MKTITLRFLLREPLEVKRLTRAGESITVTDHGSLLCVIRPAGRKESIGAEAGRRKAIHEISPHVLLERSPRVGAAKLPGLSRVSRAAR